MGIGALELLLNFQKALDIKNKAEELSKSMPGYVSNGYGDAARHALAGGLIARNISPNAAEFAHSLNENVLGLGQPWTERRMDDYNTDFGIKYGPSFPNDQSFIDYINNIQNTNLLKVLNKSHRKTKLEE